MCIISCIVTRLYRIYFLEHGRNKHFFIICNIEVHGGIQQSGLASVFRVLKLLCRLFSCVSLFSYVAFFVMCVVCLILYLVCPMERVHLKIYNDPRRLRIAGEADPSGTGRE